jgi:hypothetical protein
MGGVVKVKNRETTDGAIVDLSWPAEVAEVAEPVDAAALSPQALLDDLIGVGGPDDDDFSEMIMNAPLVKSKDERFPDVAIRKPKVMRTLD